MPTIAEFMTDSENLQELGSRIRLRRLEQNTSLAEMQVKTGLNIKTMMDLELGRDVRVSTLLKVLRALQLTANLNLMLPETLPSSEALTLRGQPRLRAHKRAKKE